MLDLPGPVPDECPQCGKSNLIWQHESNWGCHHCGHVHRPNETVCDVCGQPAVGGYFGAGKAMNACREHMKGVMRAFVSQLLGRDQ